MNKSTTWIYRKISTDIYRVYKNERNFKNIFKELSIKVKTKNLISLNSQLILALLFLSTCILAFLSLGFRYKIIDFIDNIGILKDYSIIVFYIYFVILVFFSLVFLILGEKRSDKNRQGNDKSLKILVNTYVILKRNDMYNSENIEQLLSESQKIIKSCNYRFEKNINFLYKICVLFLITPLGSLLYLVLSIGSNPSDLNASVYANELFNIIPLIAYFLLLVVVLIFYVILIVHSEVLLNFLFIGRKEAIIVQEYIGTLTYNNKFIKRIENIGNIKIELEIE